MPQLGARASSPFEAAAWDQPSHVSPSAQAEPTPAAAPPPQSEPSRSPSSHLQAPPGPPAISRSPNPARSALHEAAAHAKTPVAGQEMPEALAAAPGNAVRGHSGTAVTLFPPTAGQPLQPSHRPGSRGTPSTTAASHHGPPGQPQPMDSQVHGGSQSSQPSQYSQRPNSRGNVGRLMVAVNEHRPGSQGSTRQGASSPSRGSPLGTDAGHFAPPWSPSAKHAAPRQPSPLGSRSASPTARGKRYGSWFVPPDDWRNVYEGEGPDPEEIARLGATCGVEVEGLPMLDDIEIMKHLDSRGRQLQAQLKDKYLSHVYHNHLQERSLRSPEALEHAVQAAAQEENTSRPGSVGQVRGPGSSAALPSVGERQGSSRGAHPSSSTRPRAGTNESTFKGHDPEFIPPPAPVPFTPRNDDGAQGAPISGYGAVKPTNPITYVHPSALSALDDMELDDIISPELRAAVRRSLAMNDALTEHDKKMREYEEAKKAAKRAARFQRDLESAEAQAVAAGLPGLNRKQWARLAAQHGFSFGPAGSIVAKDIAYKHSSIQVGLPRKLVSTKEFSNRRRLPQLPTFKDRPRGGSPGQTKGVSIKRRASSPGVSHGSRGFSREGSPPSGQGTLNGTLEQRRRPVRKSVTTYKPVSGRRRAALLARGPAQAGQWGRAPRRFSTMGVSNENNMLAATGHLERDGQTDHRSRPGGAQEGSDEGEEGNSGDDTDHAKTGDQNASHQRAFAPRMSEQQGRVRDRPTFRVNVLKNVAAHRLQQFPRTSPPPSPPHSGKTGGRRWSPPSRMPKEADQLQALAQAAAQDAASKSAQQSPRELWMARQLSKATTLGGRSRRMTEQSWGWQTVRTLDDVLQKGTPRMSMGGTGIGRTSMSGVNNLSTAREGRQSIAGVSIASMAASRMSHSGVGKAGVGRMSMGGSGTGRTSMSGFDHLSMPGMRASEGGAPKLGFTQSQLEGIEEEGNGSRGGWVSERVGVQPAKGARKLAQQNLVSDRGKEARMKSLLAMTEHQLKGVQERLGSPPAGQQQQQQQKPGESTSTSRSASPGDDPVRPLKSDAGTGSGTGTSRLAKSHPGRVLLPQKFPEPPASHQANSRRAEGTEACSIAQQQQQQQQRDQQNPTVFAFGADADAPPTVFNPRHTMFTTATPASAPAAPATNAAAPATAAGGRVDNAAAAPAAPAAAAGDRIEDADVSTRPPGADLPARARTANSVSVPPLKLPSPCAGAEHASKAFGMSGAPVLVGGGSGGVDAGIGGADRSEELSSFAGSPYGTSRSSPCVNSPEQSTRAPVSQRSVMDSGSAAKPPRAQHASIHTSNHDISAQAKASQGATPDGEHSRSSSSELSPVLSACIQGPASQESTAVHAATATSGAPPPLASPPSTAVQAATATSMTSSPSKSRSRCSKPQGLDSGALGNDRHSLLNHRASFASRGSSYVDSVVEGLVASLPSRAVSAQGAPVAASPVATTSVAATATSATSLTATPPAPLHLPLPNPAQPLHAAPAPTPPAPAASQSQAPIQQTPPPHQPQEHQAAPTGKAQPLAQLRGSAPNAASVSAQPSASASQLGHAHEGSPVLNPALQSSTPTSQLGHGRASANQPGSANTAPPAMASESSATQRGHSKAAQEEEDGHRPSSCPALGKRPAWTSLDMLDQANHPPLLAQSSSPCSPQTLPLPHAALAPSQPHPPDPVQTKSLSKLPLLSSARGRSNSPPSQRSGPASATRTLNANSAFNSQLLVDGTPMARSHAAARAGVFQPAQHAEEGVTAAVPHGVNELKGEGHGRKIPGRDEMVENEQEELEEEERAYEEGITRFLEATEAQQGELLAGSDPDEAMHSPDTQRGCSRSPRRATPPPLSIHVLAVLASQVQSIGRLPALDTSFGKHRAHRPHHPTPPLPHPSYSPEHTKKGAAGQPSDWMVRTGLEPQVQAWIQQYQQRQEQAHRQQLLEQEQQLRGQHKEGNGRSHAPLQLPLLAPIGDGGAAAVDALQGSPQDSFVSDPGLNAAVVGERGKHGATAPHHQPYPHPIQELERSLQQQRQEHKLKQHQLQSQLKHEQEQQHHHHQKSCHWSTQTANGPWLDAAHTAPLAHYKAHAAHAAHGLTQMPLPRVQHSAPELPFRPAAALQEPLLEEPHHLSHRHRKHGHHRPDASKRQQQPPPSAPEVQNLSLNWLRGDRVPKQKLKGDLPEEAKHLGKGAAKAWRAHMRQLMRVAEGL